VRRLENLSLAELVDAFVSKWNLRLEEAEKTNPSNELSMLQMIAKNRGDQDGYPVIVKSGNLYYIAFKSNLTPRPYVERLTKLKILNPADYFAKFQLSQLEGVKDGNTSSTTN
jgi:hypothetical protein